MQRNVLVLILICATMTGFSGSGEEQPEFVFARLIYPSGFRYRSWATDYPKADRQFVWGVQRLSGVRIQQEEFAIRATDPELFKYPFIYSVEVGYMNLGPAETTALREYLDRGGFWVVDDFWGTREWNNFHAQLKKVFPDRDVQPIPMSHEVFHSFFDVDRIMQIPNVSNGISGYQTHQRDGIVPYCLGVFDDDGRLMVVINWNTDLGDAWEWMDHPDYPELYSGMAYRMGVNFVVYAMTH